MELKGYFHSLASELTTRAAYGTTSQIGPASRTLLGELNALLKKEPGDGHSFLAEPIFEALFNWESHTTPIGELEYLEKSLIDALDHSDDSESENEYAFPRTRYPYAHQHKSWEALTRDEARSVLIRTGTASGKTECFLVPIVNDLVRERNSMRGRSLEGVRALFLYPLNALINSQESRLNSWTKPFGSGIRYCLYNGTTPEERPPRHEAQTNKVASRKELRENPPPILVTNATMLEYMLIRQVDQPIIEKSQGSLRWIVLDEAHTYLGSQAAEVSLLLRRVMSAFAVSPKDVRFVATSATIGGEDETSSARLAKYLADLAGIDERQVTVVSGQRVVPALPAFVEGARASLPRVQELASMTPEQKFRRLAQTPSFRELRKSLLRPMQANTIGDLLGTDASADTLRLLDACTEAKNESGETFLPLRMHLFMRVQKGLWSCWNSSCHGHARTADNGDDWGFGKIFLERREHCDVCESLVFPVVFCASCGEAHLSAKEENGSRLSSAPWSSGTQADLDAEEPADDEETFDVKPRASRGARLLAAREVQDITVARQAVDYRTGDYIDDSPTAGSICFLDHTKENGRLRCSGCGRLAGHGYDGFRPVLLGGRFFLQLAIPAVLDALPPSQHDPFEKPAQGRRILTFSDSRKDTARFALDSQLGAERSFVRSFVYRELWRRVKSVFPSDILKLSNEVRDLEAILKTSNADILRSLLKEKRARLEELECEQARPTSSLSWAEMRSALAEHHATTTWISETVEHRYPFDEKIWAPRSIATILLFREFLRRSRRQTTLETLGMVSLMYDKLDKVDSAPVLWLSNHRSIEEWKAFLKICIDFYIRANTIIKIDKDTIRWSGTSVSQRTLVGPHSKHHNRYRLRWPQIRKGTTHPRLARYLRLALELPSNADVDATINILLEEAWEVLCNLRILEPNDQGSYVMDMEKNVSFSLISEGWRCPLTRRFLDTTISGYSVYQADASPYVERHKCEKVRMPFLPEDIVNQNPRPQVDIDTWLNNDPDVRRAREQGVWTEFSDRIATYPPSAYFQTAEHSAQQSRTRLKQIEDHFRDERINVLSCSTTMEMGIDIGGLNAVAMNNAPPAPANYLQRAGRAGRRGSASSVVLTMCHDAPHGRAIFNRPLWPFETEVPPPRVSLESSRIVQRHINAFALSRYLRENEEASLGLTCAWFFRPSDDGISRHKRFKDWLTIPAVQAHLYQGIEHITYGTALTITSKEQLKSLLSATADSINAIASLWTNEANSNAIELQQMGIKDPFSPLSGRTNSAAKAIHIQLRRLCDEYLLKFLSNESFLPSHGFPLHILPLVTSTFERMQYAKQSASSREDNRFSTRGEWPSRHLSVALREYAPGKSVVIDGTVYESEGVTLNWKYEPDQKNEIQQILHVWKCPSCGICDESRKRPLECPECHSSITPGSRGDVIEVLRPGGFAVAINSEPGTDASRDKATFVLPPWISAAKGRWTALASSEAGRFRYTSEGFVFHHNRGEYGYGYALCLACGRCASEHNIAVDGSELPTKMAAHRGLRTGKLCRGNDNARAIKRNICLGGSYRTDVVEIVLRDPTSNTAFFDRSALSSVAVALRQALAEHLGIETRELDWDVGPTEGEGDGLSIKLIDAAEGGAGYVAACAPHLAKLLCRAKEILGCVPDAGCDKLCHQCLLSFDTQHFETRLDRHKGLQVLSDELLSALQLPTELSYFGANSRLEHDDMHSRIAVLLAQPWVRECRVYFSGDPDAWALEDWQLDGLLRRASEDGRTITVIVPEEAWGGMRNATNDALAVRLKRHSWRLATASNEALMISGGHKWLEIGGASRSVRWATPEPKPNACSLNWGFTEPESPTRIIVGEEELPLPDLDDVTLQSM